MNFTTYWVLRLDPTDGDSLLKICRKLHDNLTGEDTENLVFSAGFSNVKVNTLEAENGAFAGSLAVAGNKLERKIIGYVVYCLGTGTVNKASCFISAGTSGSFQCASDDWYCAFSFSDGTATKTGGTGTVNSVETIYNF